MIGDLFQHKRSDNDAPGTRHAELFTHLPHVRNPLSGWCRESPLRAADGCSRGASRYEVTTKAQMDAGTDG